MEEEWFEHFIIPRSTPNPHSARGLFLTWCILVGGFLGPVVTVLPFDFSSYIKIGFIRKQDTFKKLGSASEFSKLYEYIWTISLDFLPKGD
jgi:hypothetical protein